MCAGDVKVVNRKFLLESSNLEEHAPNATWRISIPEMQISRRTQRLWNWTFTTASVCTMQLYIWSTCRLFVRCICPSLYYSSDYLGLWGPFTVYPVHFYFRDHREPDCYISDKQLTSFAFQISTLYFCRR